MVATAKQQLHELVDQLTEVEAQQFALLVRHEQAATPATSSRPLTMADILLPEAIMPDEEDADDLIEAVRQWRREGGYA